MASESWLVTKVNKTEERLTTLSTIVAQQSVTLKILGFGIGIISAGILTGVATLIVTLLLK